MFPLFQPESETHALTTTSFIKFYEQTLSAKQPKQRVPIRGRQLKRESSSWVASPACHVLCCHLIRQAVMTTFPELQSQKHPQQDSGRHSTANIPCPSRLQKHMNTGLSRRVYLLLSLASLRATAAQHNTNKQD